MVELDPGKVLATSYSRQEGERMKPLRIRLLHGALHETKCSAIFLKHIEGTMSAPEQSIDTAVHGRLRALNIDHEKDARSTLESIELPACPRVYIVNFHESDLPFTYQSVDRYARSIIQIAGSELAASDGSPVTVATAVHGPGSGLDSSEAMETLILAFASELAAGRQQGSLEEILLVENHKEVFERLSERLKYLAAKNIVRFENGVCFVNPQPIVKDKDEFEKGRFMRLGMKHLFIAMPYAKEFNNAYYFGIKHPVEQRGRKCERVDQDAFTGDIVDRVKTRIETSELVIADISGNNPNVFFETGYAEGKGKTVILISQVQNTPFDLSTSRQIRYDPEDILSLNQKLGEALDAILERDDDK